MQNYLALLEKVLSQGELREGRNGYATALFGEILKFDLTQGFPAVTTKKLYFKSMAEELAGFLRAETDAAKMGSNIWIENAKAWSGTTDMGKVYGYVWRKWKSDGRIIDQLDACRRNLILDPTSRRHVVTAWDPGRLREGCLPPCHYAFQFYRSNIGRLSCMAHMRSVDCVLGLPFDIASYALLTHLMAQCTGDTVGELTMTLGDTHIYQGHEEAVATLLARTPLKPPTLWLSPDATLDNFTADMAMLENYYSHEAMQAKLFV